MAIIHVDNLSSCFLLMLANQEKKKWFNFNLDHKKSLGTTWMTQLIPFFFWRVGGGDTKLFLPTEIYSPPQVKMTTI
jgi:hypothetical protein